MLFLDENNNCDWRLTPWDKRAFGLETSEILNIKFTDKLEGLFELIDKENIKNNIALSFFRHDSNDQQLKRIATSKKFFITEFSLYAYNYDLSNIKKSRLNLDFMLLKKDNIKEVNEVKEIASTSFCHGRFHEDPIVGLELAQKRYNFWIDDLIDSTNVYYFKIKNKVAGFFCYKVSDEWLDLPLAGLSEDAKGIGGFFWANMFNYLYLESGIKKIKMLISGSNIPVINLYSSFGFSFRDPLFGYHKYYKKVEVE